MSPCQEMIIPRADPASSPVGGSRNPCRSNQQSSGSTSRRGGIRPSAGSSGDRNPHERLRRTSTRRVQRRWVRGRGICETSTLARSHVLVPMKCHVRHPVEVALLLLPSQMASRFTTSPGTPLIMCRCRCLRLPVHGDPRRPLSVHIQVGPLDSLTSTVAPGHPRPPSPNVTPSDEGTSTHTPNG